MFNKWLLYAVLFFLRPVRFLLSEVQGDNQTDGYIRCEEGWFFFGGKCYKTFGTKAQKLNWFDASNTCKSKGGYLATVESKEVAEFLVFSQLLEENTRAWIGLNDVKSEGNYVWDDGTEFSFSNWYPGEPYGPQSYKEDCVVMLFVVHRGKIGDWNDADCGGQLAYICQVDEGTQGKISLDPTLCLSTMERGWKFGNSCYNIVKEKMTWENAEKYCQDEYNGHLVTIMNYMVDYALQYITPEFRTDIWIGIKMKDQFQQQFSSGWYGAYSWFETNRDFVEGTCVIRADYQTWEVVNCTLKYPFICEVSPDCPPVLKNAPDGYKCPDKPNDWRNMGGEFCYFIDTTNNYNWNQSNLECNKRGGSLASIHSKAEIVALTPFVKYTHPPYEKSRIFIGLHRTPAQENAFVWADGSEMDYRHWSDNEPNNKDRKCGAMLTRNMKWHNVDCEETQGYICSVRKVSPIVVATPTDINCISDIKYGTSIAVTVSLLLVMNLVTAVVCYFRPWKGKRRNVATVTDISFQPSLPPVFQQMNWLDRFPEQMPVCDSDYGYEIMD